MVICLRRIDYDQTQRSQLKEAHMLGWAAVPLMPSKMPVAVAVERPH